MKLLWSAILAVLVTWGISLAAAMPQNITIWFINRQAILLTGVLSFTLMSLIMLLAIRPAWLEKPLQGLDKIYRVHKWAGILAISFGIFHYLLDHHITKHLLVSLAGKPQKGPRAEWFLNIFRDSAKHLGEWSVWILAAILLITLWQRFPYHLWRHIHKILGAIYLALAFHAIVLSPANYWAQPVGWLLLLCAAAGSYCAVISLTGRIGRHRRYQGKVAKVVHKDAKVFEIVCQLDTRWSHQAGQFAFLTFNRREGAHPFTISGSDQGNGEVHFCIKDLGDYTRRLQNSVQAGDKVEIEGPYGCFDFRRNHASRQIWIAGGIGITPFIAWLESLQAHPEKAPRVELHYCIRNDSEAAFVAQLQGLCQTLANIDLHIRYTDEDGYLNSTHLNIGRDHSAQWPAIWFCGPQGLAETLRSELKRLGMPGRYFHQEIFQMR